MKKILLLTAALGIVSCSASDTKTDVVVDEKPAKEVVKQAADKPASSKPQDPKNNLEALELGSGIHMLVGRGGNIGVSTGADGVFVIDDKFANMAEATIAKINSLSDGPIRFVANTHYHGDHTGGNEALRGTGASIVAHDNVRVRMSTPQENKFWGRTSDATAAASWPTITFSENMTFHFNGQTIDVVHVPTAHTDGDSIIYFREADVLHMGDNFFNGLFPYVDVDGGGSVAGMIGALDKGLFMAGSGTKIIPGHGPLSSPSDMKKTRDMLADVQARVKKRIDAGDSLAEMIEAKILSDYSDLASFINEENMIKITHRSLTGRID